MSSFPLYDSLIKDIPKKDLSVKQKEEFINKIKEIDDTGRDLVYALIQFYFIENKGKCTDNLPYKGKKVKVKNGKENITWTFTDFPIKLRQILYKFVLMNIHNMDEEQARSNQCF